MNMRKIFKYTILFALLTLAFISCKDDNLIWDKSAAIRLQEAIEKLDRVLLSSEGGWKVTYYTDTANYGGYNILLRFQENGKVTIQGDNIFKPGEHTSSYIVKAPQSVGLIFETYNDAWHPLADPDTTGLGGGGGYTLGGDNELIWQQTSENEDTIYFYARKTQSPVEFVRNNENWNVYISKINGLMDDFFQNNGMNKYFKQIRFSDGSEPVVLYGGYNADRVINRVYKANDRDSIYRNSTGYGFSETGIHFTKPTSGSGKLLQDFTYSGGQFTSMENGVTATIEPISQPDYVFPGVKTSFMNGLTYYQITEFDTAMYSVAEKILDKIVAQNDIQRFYGFYIYPTQAGNGFTLNVLYISKSEALEVAAQVPLTFAYGDRDDKVILRYSIPFTVSGNYASILYDDCLAFSNLISAPSSGKPFIVIPSADYRSFIFGSTTNTIGFRLTYRGTLQ